MSLQDIEPGQSPEETGYTFAAELRAEARIEANLRILSSSELVPSEIVTKLTELAGGIALQANSIAKPKEPIQ